MKLEAKDACEFIGPALVYAAADVDALLARIRAAVEAERRAANLMHNARYSEDEDAATTHALIVRVQRRAALDALLAGGGRVIRP